ncbi:F-box only protein 43 [Holothuria leucospilota]|uniref:F-box only protein 43 n=1 Tax=Holothuria leucospilota TaxID=206669 RepID=A0A9Q0YD94_HOLLE|nr:F-box only protein 43 [Holothuria leucospilota]
MASSAVFKKPSGQSRLLLCRSPNKRTDTIGASPLRTEDFTADSTELAQEIEKLFYDDDKDVNKKTSHGKSFLGFPVCKFYSSQKLSRRHTFQSLSPSKEWFKLSPKSKMERKLKKSSKFYRNRSDSFLLHRDLCILQSFPELCQHSKSKKTPSAPLEAVKKQLFTPDSGYGSSPEADVSNESLCLTPRYPKHIIGSYVGQSRLDIISELSDEVPVLLERILKFLPPKDLLCFAQVSKRWQEILNAAKRDSERRNAYIKRKRATYLAKKENHHMVRRSRAMTQSSSVFGEVQRTVTHGCSIFKDVSKHEQFWQAKETLRRGENLMKCQTCGSPARVNSRTARAKCNNCNSDLCIKCKSSYHESEPCKMPSAWSRGEISTPKSRRNLRRL